MIIMSVKELKRPFVPRRKIWKLRGCYSTDVRQNLEAKKKWAKVEDTWLCLK